MKGKTQMIHTLWGRVYPYVSFGTIEISKHIEFIQDLGDITTSFFQWVIAGLTILKLMNDLKNKRNGKNSKQSK